MGVILIVLKTKACFLPKPQVAHPRKAPTSGLVCPPDPAPLLVRVSVTYQGSGHAGHFICPVGSPMGRQMNHVQFTGSAWKVTLQVWSEVPQLPRAGL